MKIKPGAKQESLTELPYTEAAIAGICIHANIVQTMYSDLLPVFDKEDNGVFWSRTRDERGTNAGGGRMLAREERMAMAARGEGVKEWQVRMVMEICDLGMPSCLSCAVVISSRMHREPTPLHAL